MKRYAALLILLLAGCTPLVDTATTPVDNGPLPREAPQQTTEPVQPANTTNQDLPEPIAFNDSGYEEWRTQQRDAVILLISDGETAARTYLQEGQEVTLQLRRQITVRVGTVDQDKAQLFIDNRSVILDEDSEAYNADESVIVYLSEITTV